MEFHLKALRGKDKVAKVKREKKGKPSKPLMGKVTVINQLDLVNIKLNF
jgi:hypothetical protein